MADKRILIIDTEADLLKALKLRLEAADFIVFTAKDGLTGLNKARAEEPDLIILDIMLPKLNGFKVTRFLKFDEKYKGIPLIILTAKAEESDKKLGKDLGCNEYITKPFNEEDLMQVINRLLS